MHTSYFYDAHGRLSSSVATPEPEFGDEDLALFEALRDVERETGPHGFHSSEAQDPDADPNNPEAHWRFVAGTPVIDPETKQIVFAPTIDFAQKSWLDAMDRLRGDKPNPTNGATFPVYKIPHTPRKRVRRARRKQGPPA